MAITIYDINDSYDARLAKYDQFCEAMHNALLTFRATIYKKKESKEYNYDKELLMTRSQQKPPARMNSTIKTTKATTTTTKSTTATTELTAIIAKSTMGSLKLNSTDRQDDDNFNIDDNDAHDAQQRQEMKQRQKKKVEQQTMTAKTTTTTKKQRRNKRKPRKKRKKKTQDQVERLICAYAFKTLRQENPRQVPLATHALAQ